MIEVKGKRYLILGLGTSGYAAAKKLISLGASVFASDSSVEYEVMKRSAELREEGVKIIPWGRSSDMLAGKDKIIVSPGVPDTSPVLKAANRKGIKAISELELAYLLTDSPIIAVTGTNGKSTVVTMLGEIFTRAKVPNIVAGNIGRPLIDAIGEAERETVLIVEVSSFQLETAFDFRPRIGVLLNITEDHVDRHGDMKAYMETKARLFAKQHPDDYAVVNLDDRGVTSILDMIGSTIVPYSIKHPTERGVFVDNGMIWAVLPPDFNPVTIGSTQDVKFKGAHNLENVLSAIAVSLLWNIPADAVMKAVSCFKGLSHRIEFVAERAGVRYYDDSKATNPDAVIRALEAFDEPVVLLAGGRNKGMDFSPLKARIKEKAKAAVLFGESAEEIAGTVKAAGKIPYSITATIDEAVWAAAGYAKPGDAVLLSPGCASFDMFNSYAERGRAFQDAVRDLPEKPSGEV